MALQGSSDGGDFDEADASKEVYLPSMLKLDYPDYLFATEQEKQLTFQAFSLILGGGFPNTNWIPVAYYLENYSQTVEGDFDSFTFGCVYKENVVKGPAIYHVGTFCVDNSRLITMEDEFKYHDFDLTIRVSQLDKFIEDSMESVKIRQEYINELIKNNVEIIPYTTAKISQLNYFKTKFQLMRQLKRAQDVISRKKQGDVVDDPKDVIIFNLQSQLRTLQQSVDDPQKKIASLRDESNMKKYEADINELTEKNQKSEAIIYQLNIDLKTLKTSVDNSQTKSDSMKDKSKIEKCEAEIGKLKSDLRDKELKEQKHILDMDTITLKLGNVCKRLEQVLKIKDEADRGNKIEMDNKTKEVDDVRGQIKELERRMNSGDVSLHDEIGKLQKDVLDIKAMWDKDIASKVETQNQLVNETRKNEELQELVKKMQAAVNEASVTIDEKNTEINTLKLSSNNKDLLDSKEQNKVLQIEVDETKQKLDFSKLENADLENTVKLKIAEIGFLDRELSKRITLESQNVELQDLIEEQNNDLLHNQSSYDFLKGRCKQLKYHIEREKQKLDLITLYVENEDLDKLRDVLRINNEQSGTGVEEVNKEPVKKVNDDTEQEENNESVEEVNDEQSEPKLPIDERGRFTKFLSNIFPPRDASSNCTEPKETVVENIIDRSKNGDIQSVTKSITTFSGNGDVDVSIKQRVLTPVSASEYCKIELLLRKNVKDMDPQEEVPNAVARTGFYAQHKWTRFIRQKMAGSEIYTEIHQFLEKFTDPTTLTNEDIFRICNEFHEGGLAKIPEDDSIKVLSVGLHKLLTEKYPKLESARKENLERVVRTRRQVQIEANR